MKTFSLLASIVVATVSIALFLLRDNITELSNSKTVADLLAKIPAYNKSPVASPDEPLLQSHPLDLPPGTHLTVTTMSLPRTIRKVFLAIEQAEGAGARVRRSVGTPQLRTFSPFLMLDHFSIKPGAGFPDHPHRGQETITYLLTGGVDHEDFAGNKGTIEAGDLQFMTAGKGIMHAESKSTSPLLKNP
jgi:anti-sigma factor ChrR (cupin superfamily)